MGGELKGGRYELAGELGRGGMGVVYKARDTRLGRAVAVKMIPKEALENADLRRRLAQEARAASALSHPAVATVYDFVEEPHESFIVYEYVEGTTLRSRLKGPQLDVDQVLEIGIQLADGLTAAQDRGIVHRDLKPENIMLVRGAGDAIRVKILDFGLAKVYPALSGTEGASHATTESAPGTAAGLLVGTINYMSPEQVEGDPVDHRADIHALGLVLYEMATCSNPFVGKSRTSTIANILRQDAAPVRERNSEIPAELDRIVGKCLRKRREERYQSARDLLVDLSNLRRELAAARPGSVARAEEPSVLRTSLGFARLTPLRWWELNHLLAVVVCPVLVYVAWRVRTHLGTTTGLALFVAVILAAAATITLRGFLLVTGTFNPGRLPHEVRRLQSDVRGATLSVWGVLFLMGALVLGPTPGTGALLIGFGLSGALVASLVEPAIDRGAFPSEFAAEDAKALRPTAEARAAPEAAPPLEIPRGLARSLLLVIQLGYLLVYGAAFYNFQGAVGAARGLFGDTVGPLFVQVLFTAALAGVPLRLYLASALGFDHANSGRLFRQIFPLVLISDLAWSASPLLLYQKLSWLVFLIIPLLAYMPFSQRTLVLTAYAPGGGKRSGVTPPGSA